MALTHLGSNPKWFQENMGRGGAIPLGKKSEPKQGEHYGIRRKTSTTGAVSKDNGTQRGDHRNELQPETKTDSENNGNQ